MHRISLFTLAASAAACIAASAASAQSPGSAAAGQKEQKPPSAQGPASSADVDFVQKAAASGRQEVEHGKLAASRATSEDVKAFGNTLVKDHTAANQELMVIAKRKNITVTGQGAQTDATPPAGGTAATATTETKSGATRTPTSGTTGTTGASGGVHTTGEARRGESAAARQMNEPWMSASGTAFERGFLDAQVKMHQEGIALFERQANSGSDAELKAFAQKQLPGLRTHLKRAQDLQQKTSSRN